MRQCIFVIGTRVQLVKIAPVLTTAHARGLKHLVWFTGQHDESVDDLIADFGIKSNFELPANGKERSSIGKLLVWLPATIYRCFRYVHSVRTWTGRRPLLVVHGDTLSTWLGALAGHWGGGDVVHLESGLSSGKWSDPFPEELLRRLTFRKARYALCPNAEAAERMSRYSGCIVVDTQKNTLLDCVRFAMREGAVSSDGRDYFVASIHRFQNIYSRPALERVVAEMREAAAFGDLHFILHPPTELRLRKYGLLEILEGTPGITLSPRMPYTLFLALIGGARAVFSDGGSNQEEFVPTILYRDRSERPDGLGANIRLRPSVADSMTTFIESGAIDALRQPSRLDDVVEPSRQTVDCLLKWAGAPPNDQR